MSNPNPSNNFQKGQSGNVRGAVQRGVSWKKIIAEVGDEETPEKWREYGSTYREAVVRRLYQRILEGKVEYLDFLMRYSEPNANQLQIEISDWRNFQSLGVSPQALIERYREMGQYLEHQIKVIDGESTPALPTGQSTAERPADDSGGGELTTGTETGETVLAENPETKTPG